MSQQNPASRWSDPRGNPSRWVALAFAVLFGLGALGAVFIGEARGAAILACLFYACFNAAFGKRPAMALVASALSNGRRGGPPNAGSR